MSKFIKQFEARHGSMARIKVATKLKQADHNISKILNKGKEEFKREKIKEDIQRLLER